MADRDKILRYFKASGDEELAARLVDLAEAARKTARYKVSEFLDPHGRNVAEIVAANFEGIRLESDGGFANAERSRIAFVAEDFYSLWRTNRLLIILKAICAKSVRPM